MRKASASLALLVITLAVFAPVAHATVLRNAHACCFRQHHGESAILQASSGDAAQHACCSLATLHAASPARTALGGHRLPSHPFITEFYPDPDSSESSSHQADRAPPATDSPDR